VVEVVQQTGLLEEVPVDTGLLLSVKTQEEERLLNQGRPSPLEHPTRLQSEQVEPLAPVEVTVPRLD
jgi:hypothetical protein